MQNKIRVDWRGEELDQFVGLVDVCIVDQETVPKLRRKAKLLTDRGTYSSTPNAEAFPPKHFQQSLVSPRWLANMSGVAVSNMDLSVEDRVDIVRAIQELTEWLRPVGFGKTQAGSGTLGGGGSGSENNQMTL